MKPYIVNHMKTYNKLIIELQRVYMVRDHLSYSCEYKQFIHYSLLIMHDELLFFLYWSLLGIKFDL